MVFFLFHRVKSMAIEYKFWFKKKGKVYTDAFEVMMQLFVTKKWFNKKSTDFIKGENYSEFKSIYDSIIDKKYDIVEFADMLNTLVLTFAINMAIYDYDFKIKCIVVGVLILYFIFHIQNLYLLLELRSNIHKLDEIVDKIENKQLTTSI